MRSGGRMMCSTSRVLGSDNRNTSMASWICLCLLVIVSPLPAFVTGDSGHGGYLSDVMFRSIWKGYEAFVRPVCEFYPSTTTVTTGIALRQIQDLNAPKQVLTTNVWLRVAWNDCRLTWNATYWNIPRVIVPYDVIWTPDLTLYDNAEPTLEGVKDFRLSVSSDGHVSQQFPVVIKSLCQLDVSRFPFDTQTCNLTFGSWASDGFEINMTSSSDPVDLGSFVKHVEWDVVSLTAQRIEPYFSGVPYPQVIFTLVLRRKHLFYILSVLFPCALIQVMAALAFLLPCETNEKVGLDVTVLLSLAVMQLVILDMIPASSETLPLIGIYFMLSMIVVSLSCLMTVIVLAVHYPNRHRPLPTWARGVLYSKMVKWFGIDISIIQKGAKDRSPSTTEISPGPCVSNPLPHYTKPQTKNDEKSNGGMEMNSVINICSDPPMHHLDLCTDDLDVSHDASSVSFSYGVEGERGKRVSYRPASTVDPRAMCYSQEQMQLGGQEGLQQVVDICQKILDCMKAGKKHGDHQDKVSNKMARREWELMAQFLDRVFLVVFCLLTITMSGFIYGSIA